ncbi:hypothetical protein E2C01_094941 [Portunus trituberculatus]|uniref:Uncharacterized protein n=1 Tax=Portunus trituberculatus TaxID=210409 RepID=A0A5B7JTU2_PORTR|nr:hypothetical protein [Portunus trituberculatus]
MKDLPVPGTGIKYLCSSPHVHHRTFLYFSFDLATLYTKSRCYRACIWTQNSTGTPRHSGLADQAQRFWARPETPPLALHRLHRPCQSRVWSHVALPHAHTPASQMQQSSALRLSSERYATIPNFSTDCVLSLPSTGHTKPPRAFNTTTYTNLTSPRLQLPD